MVDDYMGVALDSASGSAEAAPAETDVAESIDSEGQTSASDVVEELRAESSEGLRNLRQHAKSLEADLMKYKAEVESYRPVYEKVSEWGGVEALEPLASIHNAFAADPEEFRQQHVQEVVRQLYNLSPDNFTELAYYLADQYEPLRARVLESDEQYREYRGQQASSGIPDEELDPLDPVHAELLQLRKAQRMQQETRQQLQQQMWERQAQERVQQLDNKILLEPVGQAIDALAGWEQADIDAVKALIMHELRSDPQYSSLYYKTLQNAYEQRAIELGADQRLRRMASAKAAEVIGRYSQRLKGATAQPPRQEVGRSSAPAPTRSPQTNLRLGDPGWTDAVTKELLAMYSKRP